MEVTIAVKENTGSSANLETEINYWNTIDKSIDDLKNGRGIAFTMEALEEFVHHDLPT